MNTIGETRDAQNQAATNTTSFVREQLYLTLALLVGFVASLVRGFDQPHALLVAVAPFFGLLSFQMYRTHKQVKETNERAVSLSGQMRADPKPWYLALPALLVGALVLVETADAELLLLAATGIVGLLLAFGVLRPRVKEEHARSMPAIRASENDHE